MLIYDIRNIEDVNILLIIILTICIAVAVSLKWLMRDTSPKSAYTDLILNIEIEEAVKNGMASKKPVENGEQLFLDFPTPITKYKDGRVNVMHMVSEQYTIHRIIITSDQKVKIYESQYDAQDKIHEIALEDLEVTLHYNRHTNSRSICFYDKYEAKVGISQLSGHTYWNESRKRIVYNTLNKMAADRRYELRKALSETRDKDEVIDGSDVQWESLPNNTVW